ncbi:hypothetical protein [Celeribacter sp.]|uniref:hypothetical protein n=1 Tax=Celeribacter sp. TaxID=1890673 RepID=UPI003A8EC142
MDSINFGTGRIGEIISYLKKKHNVEDATTLSEDIKLNALLDSLNLDVEDFDALIAENSPVFRTVKGHAFESVFKYILEENDYLAIQIGGDDAVDLMVNDFSLQLKTPNMAGTNSEYVQYKTHKTHGAKSEKESMGYYHGINHFADFLVGLITYEPLNILILNQNEIPRHPNDNNKIKSPFRIRWRNHKGLNNFERLGIKNIDLKRNSHIPSNALLEVLPKSSSKLNLKSEIIIDTILTDGNFRIWDMSIRGFAREVVINNFLIKHNIECLNPVNLRPIRGDKADFAVKINGSNTFFQVKGVSTNNCRFQGINSVVATETQLTRGRVNDHPTQSRLYLKSDFEYLVLALGPPLVKLFSEEIGIDFKIEWKIFMIPTDELQSHAKMNHRINSLQKFLYKDLLKYELSSENISKIFKPQLCS